MSVKKPSHEEIETSPHGILLLEMLDASIDSQKEDEFEDAEALFKKSREEGEERIADFSEWIQGIARQPHPEMYIEDDRTESAPVTERPGETKQNDALTELNADLDQLVSEVAETAETRDQKEVKAVNAERPL